MASITRSERSGLVRAHFIIVVFFLCASMAVAECPRSREKSEAGLRKAEQVWIRILDTKDEDGLRCLLDADFIDTTWKEEIHGLDQAIVSMRARSGFRQHVTVTRRQDPR